MQILTLDSWDIEKNQILIRLEHVFEKGEDPLLSGDVTVELSVSHVIDYTMAENYFSN